MAKVAWGHSKDFRLPGEIAKTKRRELIHSFGRWWPRSPNHLHCLDRTLFDDQIENRRYFLKMISRPAAPANPLLAKIP
jgi:hypothetical protein